MLLSFLQMLLRWIKIESNKDKVKQSSRFFSAVFFCAVMSDHGIDKAQAVYPVQMKHKIERDV